MMIRVVMFSAIFFAAASVPAAAETGDDGGRLVIEQGANSCCAWTRSHEAKAATQGLYTQCEVRNSAALWGSGLSSCPFCKCYSALIASSLVLISGFSCRTMFNKDLWTSIFPLYSIKPNLRNLFMKKLTRDRVVPIISASIS